MGLRLNPWFQKIQKRSKKVKVTLLHDYFVREPDEAREPWLKNKIAISEFLILMSVNEKYRDGLKDHVLAKSWARTKKGLATAVKEKASELEVSMDQLELIYACLKTWSIPPQNADWWAELYEHVEKVYEEAKKAPK